MLSALLIVVQIFAIMLSGWMAGRFGVLIQHATSETNRLAIYLEKWLGFRTDIAFTDQFVDLVEEGYDLAIRIIHLPLR